MKQKRVLARTNDHELRSTINSNLSTWGPKSKSVVEIRKKKVLVSLLKAEEDVSYIVGEAQQFLGLWVCHRSIYSKTLAETTEQLLETADDEYCENVCWLRGNNFSWFFQEIKSTFKKPCIQSGRLFSSKLAGVVALPPTPLPCCW